MKATVPAAAVLAILAIGAALAFAFLGGEGVRGASAPAGVARPRAAERPSERDRAADLAGVATPDAEAAGSGVASAPRIDAGSARVAAAVAEPVPEEAGFRVLVVNAVDEAPLPDAEVLAFVGELERYAPERRDLARFERWVEKNGIRLRSGPDGTLRVPTDPGHPTQVVARTADLWGRAELLAPRKPDAELPRVTLHPDQTLAARIVDGSGAPIADVAVDLLRTHSSGWSWEVADARTGADGIARLAHVQVHRRKPEEVGQEDRWLLRVHALYTEMLEREIDPADLPADPVRFTLGGTGAVVVRLFDALGEPWLPSSEVTLAAIRAGEPRELSPFGSTPRPRLRARSRDGVARFPHVDAGLELVAETRRQESDVKAHAYGPGPTVAGETAELEIRFGAQNPVVQVRVIGLDGAPLADAELLADVSLVGSMLSNSSQARPRSDDDGRIRFDVAAGHAKDDVRTAKVILGERETPDAVAVIDLSRDLEPGLHDLGDVVLHPPALFVRGRVIDELGLGVPEADVELERRRAERKWWETVWELDVDSGEDGSFEVRAACDGDAFRLKASKSGYASSLVEFQPGAEVTLRLAVAGSVSGSIQADDGFPLEKLKVALVPQLGEDDEAIAWADAESVAKDGTFSVGDLAAGSYTFQLQTEHGWTALHEVPNVLVVSGRDTADPRLSGIDLRGKLHAFRLTFVRPDGKRELQGNINHGPVGEVERNRWDWFQGLEAVVVATEPAIDVDVSPRGFEQVKLRDLRGDRTIELSTGLTVRIRLRGAAPPDPPYYLKPGLSPADSNASDVEWSTPAFDEAREVPVKGVQPGRMRVSWILERRSGGSAIGTTRPSDPEIVVDVLPDVADQVFDVTLAQAALDEILAGLGW